MIFCLLRARAHANPFSSRVHLSAFLPFLLLLLLLFRFPWLPHSCKEHAIWITRPIRIRERRPSAVVSQLARRKTFCVTQLLGNVQKSLQSTLGVGVQQKCNNDF